MQHIVHVLLRNTTSEAACECIKGDVKELNFSPDDVFKTLSRHKATSTIPATYIMKVPVDIGLRRFPLYAFPFIVHIHDITQHK